VEPQICNHGVTGSNPVAGTNEINSLTGVAKTDLPAKHKWEDDGKISG
jgi:hypothetical protein